MDNHQPSKTLLMLGASVRSAAFSAIRAGLIPLCVDCYADFDLKAVASACKISQYPADFYELGPPQIQELFPQLRQNQGESIPFLITGGLENSPDLIRKLDRNFTHLGSTAEAIEASRDPFLLSQVFADANCEAIPVRRVDNPPPSHEKWLLKSIRSSGGTRCRIWNRSLLDTVSSDEHYLQLQMKGNSCSAVYFAQAEKCHLLGISEQLHGLSASVSPFVYHGSLFRPDLSETWFVPFQQMGMIATSAFRLQGIFGIDFIRNSETEQLWPCEINPRYPASLEVIEMARQISTLDLQYQLFFSNPPENLKEEVLSRLEFRPDVSAGCVVKVILFAEDKLITPQLANFFPVGTPLERGLLVDVPHPGETILPGSPVCTMLLAGENLRECEFQWKKEYPRLLNCLSGEKSIPTMKNPFQVIRNSSMIAEPD